MWSAPNIMYKATLAMSLQSSLGHRELPDWVAANNRLGSYSKREQMSIQDLNLLVSHVPVQFSYSGNKNIFGPEFLCNTFVLRRFNCPFIPIIIRQIKIK